jgi:hypothetical protein
VSSSLSSASLFLRCSAICEGPFRCKSEEAKTLDLPLFLCRPLPSGVLPPACRSLVAQRPSSRNLAGGAQPSVDWPVASPLHVSAPSRASPVRFQVACVLAEEHELAGVFREQIMTYLSFLLQLAALDFLILKTVFEFCELLL